MSFEVRTPVLFTSSLTAQHVASLDLPWMYLLMWLHRLCQEGSLAICWTLLDELACSSHFRLWVHPRTREVWLVAKYRDKNPSIDPWYLWHPPKRFTLNPFVIHTPNSHGWWWYCRLVDSVPVWPNDWLEWSGISAYLSAIGQPSVPPELQSPQSVIDWQLEVPGLAQKSLWHCVAQ